MPGSVQVLTATFAMSSVSSYSAGIKTFRGSWGPIRALAAEISHQTGGSKRTLVSEDALARHGHWVPVQDSGGGVKAGDCSSSCSVDWCE